MKKLRCNWRSLAVAAMASALASILIVAVGPGFSSPNDNASDKAKEATEEVSSTEVDSSTEAAVTETEETTEVAASDSTSAASNQVPHSDAGNSTASSTPDTHGHVGSGTGTSTGSQADPGHKPDTNGTDGKSNGPGTGDTPATTCTNKHQGADSSQGGANSNPGPYDNTCDGRISQNGQGNDAPGGGTPCAGCVGNADDKNPPGQVREFNGQKPNDMGYECDGNQGVGAHYGNGNPAHTGDCAPPPPCVDNPNTSVNECLPPPCVDDTNTPKDECKNYVRVCHVPGNAFHILELPEEALAGHLGHGDFQLPLTGGQCAPPPPCVDDTNTPKDECKTLVRVCHVPGNSFHILELPESALAGHLGHGDFQLPLTGGQCAPPPPCVDDTTTPKDECKKDKVLVCHVPGNSFQILELPEEALAGHLGHGDFILGTGGVCTPPPPDCTGDNNPNNNAVCTLTVCPTNSDRNAGMPIPSGQTVLSFCFNPPLCPVGSDLAGQQMPGGDIRNCYTDTPPPTVVCPAGTDLAGQPMPGGDIRNCNDDVLGEIIDRDKPDKPDDVLGNRDGRPAERPARVLPFTGASILAYLVLALELLGAGALLMRARKKR